MKHYWFEIMDGDYEGEEFLVGADTKEEAHKIASEIAEGARVKCYGAVSEALAEASGLDEY